MRVKDLDLNDCLDLMIFNFIQKNIQPDANGIKIEKKLTDTNKIDVKVSIGRDIEYIVVDQVVE